MYRSRFIASMMKYMGYDAVAVGERELAYGRRVVIDEIKEGTPFICTNVYMDGEPLFRKSVSVRVGEVRVGVLSVLGESPREPRGFEVRDPVEGIGEEIKELRRKNDVVILLAHMNRGRLKEMIPVLSGVDLIIRGHTADVEEVKGSCVDTIGGTFEDMGIPVFFAGDRGRVLGKVDLAWNSDDGLRILGNEVITLKRSMRRDSLVTSRMMDFFKGETKRRKELKLRRMVARDDVTGRVRERYLGMEMCARCHTDVYDSFMLTKHFMAFSTISSGTDRKDPECLRCHATGFGEFSGYDPETESSRGVNLRGVQCEACHGPGTKHARDGSYRKAALSSCRKCHTSRWSPDFEFEKYWNRIKHQCRGIKTESK